MTAPLIGISAYPRMVGIVPAPTLLHTVSRFYVEAVARAGGLPVILPVMDAELAPSTISRIDGLVLTGGGDVDPAHYGAEPDAETASIDPDRDGWELACARAAIAVDLPLLAICRGAQVLNVALGGSLVQHVPAATGARHSWSSRSAEHVHEVRIAAGCRLAAVVGSEAVGTNSLHHQAVAEPGAGVRPVGWAPDGTIEAFEVDGHSQALAVQWHPELMVDDPVEQGLFRDLVERARRAL